MFSAKVEQFKSIQRLIDSVNYPQDIRAFDLSQLKIFAQELREETINAVSKIGGHLGAGLGVVELTVALHYVFNTPHDLLVWDIGHQTYPHKILTGRKDQIHTLRQPSGLSGFLKRSESQYDVFGAGHSSTSISAALGMSVARDLKGEKFHTIAIIGDGALTAGMAYEAMNNAGHLKNRMIVILNDNDMSIAPNVGAMHKYLSRLTSSKPYLSVKHMAKNMLHYMPPTVENIAKKAKRYAKDFVNGGNFFEEIGFHYVGPLDGHDLDQMIPILSNIRDNSSIENPILIHIKTQKGKGFDSPNVCDENFHAVSKFDNETKIQIKAKASKPTYTEIFSKELLKIMQDKQDVVAITAAMPSGTGLSSIAQVIPSRVFDVGIAEQHAVTFAAGLALQGIIPFCAIFSTFLQRGYDQVVHDVAIQSIPVRFIIDRAGLVGGDGPTHAGAYDINMLACLPNFVIMAPSDENELAMMLKTSLEINDRPSAIRFPRGECVGIGISDEINSIEIGKGRFIKKGKDIAIISLGTRLEEVKIASLQLAKMGINITIFDARFAKPFDKHAVEQIANKHKFIITIEEGAIGGFGSHISNFLADSGYFDKGLKFRSLFLPDFFIEHNLPYAMCEEGGINASKIVQLVTDNLSVLKANDN